MMWWSLPYNSVNQPRKYTCVPSLLNLPPQPCTPSTPLGCLKYWDGLLCHTAISTYLLYIR